MLGGFGSALPELFDERIRYFDLLPPPVDSEAGLGAALKGGANAGMLRCGCCVSA